MTRRLKRVEVNRSDFRNIVTDRNGCTFVSLRARTIPQHFHLFLGGKVFPWCGNIYCYQRVTCAIGFNFENSVNNARERRGARRNFQISGEPWGPAFQHVDAALIESINDDRLYLQVKVQQREYDYRRADNNHRIPIATLRRWMKDDGNTEGVLCRRYRFDHLLEVVMRTASESASRRYILTD